MLHKVDKQVLVVFIMLYNLFLPLYYCASKEIFVISLQSRNLCLIGGIICLVPPDHDKKSDKPTLTHLLTGLNSCHFLWDGTYRHAYQPTYLKMTFIVY